MRQCKYFIEEFIKKGEKCDENIEKSHVKEEIILELY